MASSARPLTQRRTHVPTPPAPPFFVWLARPPPLQVLEAHILAALSPATRHLILIGDHLQLRPSTAVYELARKFGLDVSLFERLVRAGVDHATLTTQRRMRPEVASLLRHIYPFLQDHDSCLDRGEVRGMLYPVYFLQHSFAEGGTAAAGRSRTNVHEAEVLARLAAWLLLHGYAPEQLVALTPYVGQLAVLREAFGRAGRGADGVRLRSVDQYQGEEADIVLLSLVRSNEGGSIGFLGVDNRVCVALSRARLGLYVVGDAALLRSKRPLWENVLSTLEQASATGRYLPLAARRSASGATALVATAADFDGLVPEDEAAATALASEDA